MDVKLINPFIDAVASVLPQLGFQSVSRGNLRLGAQQVESLGVTVLIGIAHQVRGNVAYNMSLDTAKKIASTMMMGMPVPDFDDMAQSAIAEMVNMITANAAMNLEKTGLLVDISPPNVVAGKSFTTRFSQSKFIVLELLVDGLPLEVNIGVES